MTSLLESVFGAAPPDEAFDQYCRSRLGNGVREVIFERASSGIVRGFELEDGRRVVVKAHQPAQDEIFLSAVCDVQRFLHSEGYPAPLPLADPAPLGRGYGLAQELREEGTWEDAHRPEIRRELARSLARQLELMRGLGVVAGLARGWRLWEGTDVWPPAAHSPIFDFAATAAGAERIDDWRRAPDDGSEPVRRSSAIPTGARSTCVSSTARSRSSTNWDSLDLSTETRLVGTAAATFTANFELDIGFAPTPDEARAFVADYCDARPRPLSRAERDEIAATTLYVIAYSARCEHALGRRGDFVEALERFGVDYLAP